MKDENASRQVESAADVDDQVVDDQVVDDQALEIPTGSLPRVSILWMIGVVTVSALAMLVFRLAYGGNKFAMVGSMLIVLGIVTVMLFVLAFLIGYWLDSLLRRSSLSLAAPLMGAALALGGGSLAHADQVWSPRYPSGRNPTPYRVSVSVSGFPRAGGYQTLDFRFQPIGKQFVAGHRLQIEVTPRYGHTVEDPAGFTGQFTIEQDLGTQYFRMHVPFLSRPDRYDIRILDGGSPIAKSRMRVNIGGGMRGNGVGQEWTIGIIDPAIGGGKGYPDVTTLISVLGQGPLPTTNGAKASTAVSRNVTRTAVSGVAQFRDIGKNDLEKTWLGYSGLDVILANARSIDWIEANQPESWTAIRDFVVAGGRLWVTDAGDVDSLLTTVTPIAGGRVPVGKSMNNAIRRESANDEDGWVEEGWRNRVVLRSQQYGMERSFPLRGKVWDDLKKAKSPITTIQTAAEITPRIRLGDYGLGKVVLISDAKPFPGSLQFWESVANASGREPWIEQAGADTVGGTESYWSFLLAGIGGPPVKSFLILNSLFVITIGPLAYRLLRKNRRLHLMYFAAPALAAIVTGGLFLFAFVSDGVRNRIRSVQMTFDDQVNGKSVNLDRCTIYSPFGLGQLEADMQTCVLPVAPFGAQRMISYGERDRQSTSMIQFSGDTQRWGGSFIPTRRQVQYLLRRPQQNANSSFLWSDDGAGKITLTNRGGQRIRKALYTDAAGTWFECGVVEPEETVELTKSGLVPTDWIGPELPTTIDTAPVSGSTYSMWDPMGYRSVSPIRDRPLLERRLLSFLGGAAEPRTFAVIADPDSDRLPISGSLDDQSVAITLGRLP